MLYLGVSESMGYTIHVARNREVIFFSGMGYPIFRQNHLACDFECVYIYNMYIILYIHIHMDVASPNSWNADVKWQEDRPIFGGSLTLFHSGRVPPPCVPPEIITRPPLIPFLRRLWKTNKKRPCDLGSPQPV